ncbi:MAG: PQQ-binding-like beta-propeller repeat protein, partial [Chloroflexi bacterium]|nr:PQQ-binding-like beta-propeller repeat protein [Chloroflexota bacterium]
PTVEVAHEALIREWRRLHEWLDASRADVRFQRMLATAASEWEKGDRDPSYLLSGAQLAAYLEWHNTSDLALTPEEAAFLDGSRAERERQEAAERARRARETALEARSRSRLRVLVLVMMMATLIGLGLSTVAFTASNNAEIARATSDFNAEIALAAQATAERSALQAQSLALAAGAQQSRVNGQPDIAAALSVAAFQLDRSSGDSQRALVDAAAFSQIRSRLSGHADSVWGLAINPEGTRALSGSADTSLILWDLDADSPTFGQVLLRLGATEQRGHSDTVHSVAYGPDGLWAISASADERLIQWNLDPDSGLYGEPLRVFEDPQGHTGPVQTIAISPDGEWVLSAGDDALVILWEIATGEPVWVEEAHRAPVQSVAFNPEGTRAVSVGFDMMPILWDVDPESPEFGSGFPIGPEPDEEDFDEIRHTDWIWSVAFHPTEPGYVLTASGDSTLIMWDVDEESAYFGEAVGQYIGTGAAISTAAFSPDGSQIISGSFDNTVALWDTDTAQLLQRFEGHTDWVEAIAFTPSGREVLSTSFDQTLILWDVTTEDILNRYTDHFGPVHSVAYSSDGRNAISASGDGTLIWWDTLTGDVVHHLAGGHQERVWSVAISPDDRMAVSGGFDNQIIFWDLATGDLIRRIPAEDSGHTDWIGDLAFSPDGARVLAASFDKTMTLWDVASGRRLLRMDEHTDSVYGVAFNPVNNGMTAVSGARDERLLLWDLDPDSPTYGQIVRQYGGHNSAVWSVDFSPDGTQIMSGGRDASVILWDAETGAMIHRMTGHTNAVVSVVFAPDGQGALSASWDETLMLWDLQTGLPQRRFVGHRARVWKVAFSPAGATALSASDDATLIRWDVAPYDNDLLTWVLDNRYIPALTCEQRAQYNLDLCDEAGGFPTSTPHVTSTPTMPPRRIDDRAPAPRFGERRPPPPTPNG